MLGLEWTGRVWQGKDLMIEDENIMNKIFCQTTEVKSKCCNSKISIGNVLSVCTKCGNLADPITGESYTDLEI